jgi:hypothetical protein
MTEVFFADTDDHFDGLLYAQDFPDGLNEGFFFAFVTEDVQLFKLVKDEVDRLKMAQVDGFEALCLGGEFCG